MTSISPSRSVGRALLLRRHPGRRGAELGLLGIGTSIAANGLAIGPILVAGTEEQKRDWLGPLVEAPVLGCFGLTEPGAGSDVSGSRRRPCDGVTSTWSTARRCSSPTPGTPRGWSASRRPTARGPQGPHRASSSRWTPTGVMIEKKLDKMGQRATDTSAVAFQDVVVPVANRLGEEGEGFKIAMQTLDFTRPGPPSARSAWPRRPSSSRWSTRGSASSSGCRSR